MAAHRAWIEDAEATGTAALKRLRADVKTIESIETRMRKASKSGRVDDGALLQHSAKNVFKDLPGGEVLAELIGEATPRTTASPANELLRREIAEARKADLRVARSTVELVRQVRREAENRCRAICDKAAADPPSGVMARWRERRRIRATVAEVVSLADSVHAQIPPLRQIAEPYK